MGRFFAKTKRLCKKFFSHAIARSDDKTHLIPVIDALETIAKRSRTRCIKLCVHYNVYLFVSTRNAVRYSKKKNNNNNNDSGLEQIVHTHGTSDRCGWPRGFCELNIPVLSSEYFLPCQLVPVLAPTYSRSRSTTLQSDHLFTLHQSVAQNLSDM